MIAASASFRDPSGRCFLVQGRVLRVLEAAPAAACEAFLNTACARDFTARRRLVETRKVNPDQAAALRAEFGLAFHGESISDTILEHERVPFASYPCEWPPEMLWEAGRLTLELARAALLEGFGLKDATPYNVLFRGFEPVFIDVPSFERRDPGDPVWRPYGQFVRTFLLPLLANRYWDRSLTEIFLAHRDGLEPEEVYRTTGPLKRLRPPFLSLVSLPTWLGSKARAQGPELYRSKSLSNPEKARFILDSLLKRLQRSLDSLKPRRNRDSLWSNYMDTHTYQASAFAAKEHFVETFLREFAAKRVLDVGANTGHFSALAARSGASVTAIDLDPACVGALWTQARENSLDILPLVIDLGRPTPALGWGNRETPSFLERAAGQFDGVLMLAVLHHLLVTERVPLDEILKLASGLTTNWLIIEFVSPRDEMFQQLTRGRDHLHASLDAAAFERACAPYFDIVRSAEVPGAQRRLYGLRRKRGAG